MARTPLPHSALLLLQCWDGLWLLQLEGGPAAAAPGITSLVPPSKSTAGATAPPSRYVTGHRVQYYIEQNKTHLQFLPIFPSE